MSELLLNMFNAFLQGRWRLGVNLNSDASSLTLLLQDDEVRGLQIRHSSGWTPVKTSTK